MIVKKELKSHFKKSLYRVPYFRHLFLRFRYPGIFIHNSTTIVDDGGEFGYTLSSSIDKGTTIILTRLSRVHLGEKVWVGKNALIEPLSGKIIMVGRNSSIQDNCRLIGDIFIGSNTLLAPNVFISSGRHFFDIVPPMPIRFQDRLVLEDAGYESLGSNKVVIEDDCWIGTNTVIMPGVKICKGSVIGANSVVTKSVPPYTVVAGAPSKVLKKRLEFNPPIIIKSSCMEHLPYFYQGFILKYEDLQMQENIGIETSERFVICLKPNPSNKSIYLLLNFDESLRNAYLEYEGKRLIIDAKMTRYNFDLIPKQDNLYSFRIIFEDGINDRIPGHSYLIEAGTE